MHRIIACWFVLCVPVRVALASSARLRQEIKHYADLNFETGEAEMIYEGAPLTSNALRPEDPGKAVASRVLVVFHLENMQLVARVRAVWWEVVLQLRGPAQSSAATSLFRKVKHKKKQSKEQDSTKKKQRAGQHK